jgi:solute:Na+ symporter, SSS family
MNDRSLSAANVAVLLVSASYGIGFVFGTGELARSIHMASSLYAVATAIGMLCLAFFAAAFWRMGAPVWAIFRAKHLHLERGVAILSSLWLLGIFAVQLQGAAAVLRVNWQLEHMQYPLVGLLVWTLSQIRPGKLGILFSIFLAAASLSLCVVIFNANGLDIYAQSLSSLVKDTQTHLPLKHVAVIVLSTIALVILGADYQQFVVLARSSRAAVVGCLLAAAVVLLISTLPATAVLAAIRQGQLPEAISAKESIPYLVALPFGGRDVMLGKWVLVGLFAAALGSSATIAMAASQATKRALHWDRLSERAVSILVVLAGIAVAQAGISMIGLIVSLNTLFLTTITVPMLATLTDYGSGRICTLAMAASFAGGLLSMILLNSLFGEEASIYGAAVGIGCGVLVFLGWEFQRRFVRKAGYHAGDSGISKT